jgi:hypothetical protein
MVRCKSVSPPFRAYTLHQLATLSTVKNRRIKIHLSQKSTLREDTPPNVSPRLIR